jgi:hypothetical protein
MLQDNGHPLILSSLATDIIAVHVQAFAWKHELLVRLDEIAETAFQLIAALTRLAFLLLFFMSQMILHDQALP